MTPDVYIFFFCDRTEVEHKCRRTEGSMTDFTTKCAPFKLARAWRVITGLHEEYKCNLFKNRIIFF